jgi:hypothetical protein
VLFSSVGSGLGNIGQASYATANACLDARSASQRSCGKVACSVQWPLVGGAGMGAAAFAAIGERQVTIVGLAGISLEEYASCLGSQLAGTTGVALSVKMAHLSDMQGFLRDVADATQGRFGELVALAERGCVEPVAPTARASLGSGETHLLATSALSQRRTHVEVSVLRAVRELTGVPSAALTAETPLMEAGVDSPRRPSWRRDCARSQAWRSRQRSFLSSRRHARSPPTCSRSWRVRRAQQRCQHQRVHLVWVCRLRLLPSLALCPTMARTQSCSRHATA